MEFQFWVEREPILRDARMDLTEFEYVIYNHCLHAVGLAIDVIYNEPVVLAPFTMIDAYAKWLE